MTNTTYMKDLLQKSHGTALICGVTALMSLGAIVQPVSAVELQNSEIGIALHQLRYATQDKISEIKNGNALLDEFDDPSGSLAGNFDEFALPGKKNVLKAGLLSLLVPGLGQLYNGSHIGKVALFASAEVGFLLGASKFDSDANETVADFEAFARTNWNEQDYWSYLNQVYKDTTDAEDNLGASHGHHLPDTETQQYFEMVGKYDQFSFGWARAQNFGPDDTLTWDSTNKYGGNPYPSANRDTYNTMRADANDSFDSRDKMVIFVLVNHLVSSVDAIVSANRHNRRIEAEESGLSFHPSIRHDGNWALIPEVKLSWSF